MSDRLAVIQSEETIKELNSVDERMKTLILTFKDLVQLGDKISAGLMKGTPKEFVAAEKEKIALNKQWLSVLKERAALESKLADVEKKRSVVSINDAKARKEAANAERSEMATKQKKIQLSAAEERAAAKTLTAYKKFSAEVLAAKNRAKDLGAEMIDLEARFKRGVITQKEYNTQLNKLSKEFTEAKVRAMGLDAQVKKLDASVGDNQRNVGNYKSAIGGLTGSFRNLIAAFGVVSAVDMFADLARSSFETVKQLNAQNAALNQIFETEAQVAFQREYISKITDQYGLNLVSTTDAYTKFAAAVRGSALEGEEARKIFTAFAGASAKLALSADQQAGIFRALEQMISKGKIQAEELRGQLGDRMAGSFKLFADALGLTTMELDAMLQKGEVLAVETLPKAAEQLGKFYDLSARADTLTAAQERFRNSWTTFLNDLASNKDVVNDLAAGFETLTEVVSFLLDTIINRGADGSSVVSDLVNVLQDLIGVVADIGVNLGVLDKKQGDVLFSMQQMKADFMQIRSVALVLGGAIEYLAETLGNLFKLGEGWDAYIKRSNDAYDKLMAKMGQYQKMQADSKILEAGGKLEIDEHAKAWDRARKAKQAYFQLNGKYFNTSTGRNTGKSLDDYVDRNGKLEAKPKAPAAGGGSGDKAAKDAEKAAKKAAREAEALRKKQEAAAKKEKREQEAALKAEFERERDNIENLYKVRLEAVKNNIELAKKDPYATDVQKIENQIRHYDELIRENNNYYNALIANAKKYGEKTTDLETSRDVSSISMQGNRNELYGGMMGASQADISRTSEYLKTLQGITFEEQKQKILSDQTLDVTQREYLLGVLEKDNQIIQNNLEIERLKTMRGQLAAKLAMAQLGGAMLTPEEMQQLATIDETIAGLENANIQLNLDIVSSLSPQLETIKNLLSAGFQDMGLDNFANQFDNLFNSIKDKTADWKDYMVAAAALVADLSSQYVEAQKDRQIAALDEQLKASQEATEQELGFIEGRLNMLNSLEDATKEQISERSALEDEARTLREQQMVREKMIEAQKAKAQQRASAQQAVINGILGATMAIAQLGPIAGAIPAAIALATGGIMAALIMAKDPVPKYFVGRKGGPAEIAWTQEKGRELVTGEDGTIKSLGSDSGPALTKLDAGDNVYTASETAKILADFDTMPKVGAKLFNKIARQNISPVFVNNQTIDIDALANKIGDRYEMTARKYDKEVITEDADGNIFKQRGGRLPEFIGKKKAQKQNIEIKIKNNNVRD